MANKQAVKYVRDGTAILVPLIDNGDGTYSEQVVVAPGSGETFEMTTDQLPASLGAKTSANSVSVVQASDDNFTVIIRQNTTVTAIIAESAALSGEIDMRQYAGAILHMPAAWTAASIGFQVSATSGGTFTPLYDEYGSLVQITGTSVPTVDRSYVLPAKLFAGLYVKLWSQNGSGTGVNQAAARSIAVDLKA